MHKLSDMKGRYLDQEELEWQLLKNPGRGMENFSVDKKEVNRQTNGTT